MSWRRVGGCSEGQGRRPVAQDRSVVAETRPGDEQDETWETKKENAELWGELNRGAVIPTRSFFNEAVAPLSTSTSILWVDRQEPSVHHHFHPICIPSSSRRQINGSTSHLLGPGIPVNEYLGNIK